MTRVVYVGLVLLLAAGQCAMAGTWSASSHVAWPGQNVTVNIHFQGDGVTNGTDVSWRFSTANLVLEAPAGILAGAGQAGQCGYDGWGTVSAIYASLGSTPLPSTNTLVCSFTLKVRDNAQPGLARILGVSPVCVRTDGDPAPCTVVEGSVTVQGQGQQGTAYAWGEQETNELAVIFTPLAGALKSADPVRGLLPSDSQPRAVRPFVGRAQSPSEQAHYRARPDLASARLHRLWLAEFPDPSTRDRALEQLRASPLVESAEVRRVAVYGPVSSAVKSQGFLGFTPAKAVTTVKQEHLQMSSLPQAWSLARGWGLVAVVDGGIALEHPEFKSFSGPGSLSGTLIPGGNYLPHFSANVAGFEQAADAIDELTPSYFGPPDYPPPTSGCPTDGDGLLVPPVAGHGTHVAGLVAANAADAVGVSGVCRDCGLGVVKTTFLACLSDSVWVLFQHDLGVNWALEAGAQVINLSGGDTSYLCTHADSGHPLCVLAKSAHERDVFFSVSSGNSRSQLQAPADSLWAVAVGGIHADGQIWDRSPGIPVNSVNCPYYDAAHAPYFDQRECGSNYSKLSYQKQELVTLADGVVSTAYPGRNWSTEKVLCGDSIGLGAANDGIGECTGTSMSAPQVSGIVGLLRSIHPLLRVGSAFTQGALTPGGLRKVLADTASRSSWDTKLGFGQPDAAAAARKLLGVRDGEAVRNRAIPLFSLSHAATGDYAAVATPQLAMALSIPMEPNTTGYLGDGFAIPGYPSFPTPQAFGVPRARAFVLSTEHSPRPGLPPLDPLFLMVRTNGATRDHILVNGYEKVQVAANEGYRYAGRQGYLYRDCTGLSGCVRPPGTELLYLRCRSGGSCAVFPQGDNPLFDSMGYKQNFPGLNNPRLGYAYKRGDYDGDGLPDAAEYVLGTRRDIVDTDGDGVSDAAEYPFTDVPVSDPCDGQQAHRCVGRWSIFFDGFED